jgi:hypothetical protein
MIDKVKLAYSVAKILARWATKLFIFMLMIYGLVYGVVYARTQRACLGYEFEITEVTYDLKPFCASLFQGSEIVKPLDVIIKIENSLGHPVQGL